MRTTTGVRRALTAVATAAALVVGLSVGAASASAAPALPAKMAALGDSITQASMTCSALLSCPTNSWSTGTAASVASHATRLRQAGAQLTTYNDAVPGAVAAGLPAQATRAAGQGAQYVTIEIGANDACKDSVSQMTSTDAFAASIQTSLATLAASQAKPEIFVASIPNLKRLLDLNKSSVSARLTWALLGLCKSMLASPTSTKAADVERREAVQTRVNEYNLALEAACAATAKCRWDGYAVAGYAFAKSDISTRDYFHPSVSGQASLAAVTWEKTQWRS
ncbi:GDSL-type esterase/lipase family protein [Microbacterium terricola]|uniref:Lipoprotein n=1 Tax=Microbacterium terricola TaxID=344163 RepID=A0ABM8E192_9MICO|nr:GDSL-type esterase/lipase family protein [Microbacterium terricola]UYK40565.1 GDSL-type esterase/lipase family protein [Microbacterium terricola]BDV31708.1 lipoprotein [Microbacterium terricola]